MGAVASAFSSPFAGLAFSSMNTGISTAAAYRDAQARNAAAELNAQTYDQNAALSRIRADNYRQLGDIESADVLREYKTLQGEQRAAYGASGVSVNAGSAAAVQANTAAEGVYESQKTKYARDLDAWEAEQQAAQYDFEARKQRANKANPYVSAATAAIGGLNSMYSTYSPWKNAPGKTA